MFAGKFGGFIVIPLQMTDYPEVPHGIARRGNLGVILPIPDQNGIPVPDNVSIAPYGGKAEALGGQEAVMVYLRLGMVVRGIAGPLPRYSDNFPNNQVGFGPVGIVKDGSDDPGRGFPHGPFSPEFAPAFFGAVEPGPDGSGVIRGRIAELRAPVPGPDGYRAFGGDRKAPGGIIKQVGPGNLPLLAVPGNLGRPLGQKKDPLIGPGIAGIDIPGEQLNYPKIHKHIRGLGSPFRKGGIAPAKGRFMLYLHRFLLFIYVTNLVHHDRTFLF
jgi:hypothetical protein